MSIRLAIDAMGGDDAPDMIIGGVGLAQKAYPQVFFLLYGDEGRIAPLISQYGLDPARIQVIHTDEVITGDMKPSAALRGSKSSSMRLAIEAVAEGRADAVVSAGNTGAYMALSKMILKTLPGIDRPAIAASIPTMLGRGVMLDLGANVECTTENLLQFALMGQVFSQQVLGNKVPSVGLLNIGEEDLKGNAVIKETHAILKEKQWVSNFKGFVEGTDVLTGKVDVIVTDGFTGNVSIKTAEGSFTIFKQFLVANFNRNWWTRFTYLLASPVLKAFSNQFDPRRNNGAPFLGLNGISVKSHGNTDASGFSYAIAVAVDMVDRDVNRLIREGLEKWHADLASKSEDPEAEVIPLMRAQG
jgi:glycerol-3-phosphate acyltransferase PlsX